MREIRLYVDQPLDDGAEVRLDARAAEHACRVLRLRSGDQVTLFNGDGNDYAACLTACTRDDVHACIETRVSCTTESPAPVTLAQCLARGEKMDVIVQKATELGASCIVPLISERSEVRLDAKRAERRVAHWRGVAVSACEQCGRARLPVIDPVQHLATWCAALGSDEQARLVLVPGSATRLRDNEANKAGTVFVIGPEGGLAPADLGALHAAGFVDVGLGPRVLRTETAGPAVLAAWQSLHGDG